MSEPEMLEGEPVCGKRGQVRFAGAIGGGLVRGEDVCMLPAGHEGPHAYVTVFPASRIGRQGQEEEE